MITACPNCGIPICSDCGRHLNPGTVGAAPAPRVMPGAQRPAGAYDPVTRQPFALFQTALMAVRPRVFPNIVGPKWDDPWQGITYGYIYAFMANRVLHPHSTDSGYDNPNVIEAIESSIRNRWAYPLAAHLEYNKVAAVPVETRLPLLVPNTDLPFWPWLLNTAGVH